MGLLNLFRPSIEKMRNRGDIQGLVRALEDNSRSSLERRDAASALGNCGDSQAVAPLTRALEDNSRPDLERWTVARALGKTGDLKAVAALIKVLSDLNLNSIIREGAIEALGNLRASDAVQPIALNALHSPIHNLPLREGAIDALRAIGGQEAAQAIITFLYGVYNTDEKVCVKAVKALREIGDSRAVEALIRVINSENQTCIVEACITLGNIGDKSAADAMITALSNRSLEGPGYYERAAAIKGALKKIGVNDEDISKREKDTRWQIFSNDLRAAITKLPCANASDVKNASSQHAYHGTASTGEEVCEQIIYFFQKAQEAQTSFHNPRVESYGEFFRAIFFHGDYFDGIIVYKTSDYLPNRYLLLRAPTR